jgi:DNA-binding LacI/PurR family transcriptional regulator
MEDVARHVGVAKSTVSLALNNKPGVSAELREAILHAAGELGYALPQRKSPKPGTDSKSIVVVHGEYQPGERGPTILYLKYLEGIRAYCDTHNVNFSLFANYREEPANLTFQLLSREQLAPNGFILMGSIANHEGQLVQQLLQQNIPTVALSRNWPDLPLCTVSQDHAQQVQIALKYLFELGHHKIGFIARDIDRQSDWFDWRLRCYKEIMLKYTGTLDETLIVTGVNGSNATKALLKQRPDVTAIFAINDQRAIEVYQGVQELGLRIPQDISIIGVDNIELLQEGSPDLTTVTFPHFEIGYLGAELLLKQIENNALYYANIIVQSELVVRESCAALNQSDSL